MRSTYFILPLVGLISGCASLYVPGSFSYNGTKHNGFIKNRRPDYGDGHSGGCIIWPTFGLQLNSTSSDSIVGMLYNAKTKQAVPDAVIQLFQADLTDTLLLTPNRAGRFAFKRSYRPLRIMASGEIYQTLDIDLTGRRIFR